MVPCLETITEIGEYSQATVTYSGLVAESLVKRCGMSIKKCTRSSSLKLQEAGEYSMATMQYAGMASYSILIRSGAAAGACAQVVVSPISRAVQKPFSFVAERTSRVFRRKSVAVEAVAAHCGESIKALESKVLTLEERIVALEKYGVRPSVTAEPPRVKKALSDDRRAFLRAIVDENRLLRSAQQR